MILCSLQLRKAWLLSYPQGSQLGFGGWDLIVIDEEFHILKSQTSSSLLLYDFTQCSHTLLNCFQRENGAVNLNQLEVFLLWFSGELQPLSRNIKA